MPQKTVRPGLLFLGLALLARPINVRPLGAALASERTKPLVKADAREVTRLVVPAWRGSS